MRIPRLTAVAAAGLTLLALAGCRTSPNVAAYVGDERVTVSELEAAIDQRTADEAIAQVASADPDAYTRRVLGGLVEDEIHALAAERYGVEVDERDVRDRIDELLAGQNPDEVFTQLASQGLSRQDAFSTIGQQLIRLRIAEAEGLADDLSEEQLRVAYEEVRGESAQYELGLITVPDAAAAAAAAARLAADPGSYAELAAEFAGDFTLSTPTLLTLDRLPQPVAEEVAGAAPGSAFAVPVEEVGGIVIGYLVDVQYPTFDELRPQLEQEALGAVEQQVAALIDEVRESADVTVNPRYGRLDDGSIAPADGGVVDILDGS